MASLVTFNSIHNDPYFPLVAANAGAGAGIVEPRVNIIKSQGSLKSLNLSSLSDVRKIQTTLKLWKEVVNERLGESRVLKNKSTEHNDLFLEDQGTLQNYVSIIKFVQTHMSRVVGVDKENIKIKDDQKSKAGAGANHDESADHCEGELIVQICLDQDKRVQSIGIAHFNNGELYINNLLSAPWNIKMNGKVPEEYLSAITAGAGKTLVRSMYVVAQQKKANILLLTPSKASYGFYNHLGMTFDSKMSQFFFPVSAELPAKLR